MYKRSKDGEARRIAAMPKGKKHWRYNENPSILAIHKWMMRYHGRPSKCEFCGITSGRFEWALKHGRKYERIASNFLRLCKKCHNHYDDIPNKVSKALKGKPGHMKGYKHSAQSRHNMSIAHKGKKYSLGRVAMAF